MNDRKTPPRRGDPGRDRAPHTTSHDCANCTITQIDPYPAFPPGSTTLRIPISVKATKTLTLKAVRSDPDCPCEWNNRFQVAGFRIATGHTTLTRKSLEASPSPLYETHYPRLNKVDALFHLNGCTLTIDIQDLDQTLRNGIGLANNLVMTEIGLQVRCAPKGKWRNIDIVVGD